jgi:hypothetical protein
MSYASSSISYPRNIIKDSAGWKTRSIYTGYGERSAVAQCEIIATRAGKLTLIS